MDWVSKKVLGALGFANDKMAWIQLSKIRNSFVSKAFMALSISAMVLSNVPDFMQYLAGGMITYKIMFWGSVLFLSGYLAFAFRAPSEFANAGEIHEHVSNMLIFSDQGFRTSRLQMSNEMLKSWNAPPKVVPDGMIIELSRTVELIQAKPRVSISDGSDLFTKDLIVRQYRHPVSRVVIGLLLVLGGLLLVIPTLANASAVLVNS